MKRLRTKSPARGPVDVLACVLVLLGASHAALGISVKLGAVRPSNDDCSNSKPVGNVTNLSFDTRNATFDGPGHYMNSPNVWYCYTATCTGGATISLAGSSFDTKLAVYDRCGCYPASGALIKANDDSHGQQSEVSLPVVAGHTYLIEVGGYNATVKGQGVMTITCDAQANAPANNNCSNAEQVGNVTNRPFNTTYATFDGPGHCLNSPNIWYRYTAAATGQVTVSLLGSSYDTKLAVYRGNNCYPAASALVGCNDDFGSRLTSQITFQATGGQGYLIEVGGYNSDAIGAGVISITGAATPPPPATKDDCASAQTVGNVTNQAFTTTGATFDGPGLCMTSPNIWYRYIATCTGNVTVSLAGSSYDTMLAVYQGSQCYPNAARLIQCNDDSGSSYQSAVTFAATSGSQYLLEIGGYGSATGQGKLTINCQGQTPPPSSKDDCAGAQAVGNVTNLAFDTTSATFDGPGHCMNSPNIWYRYTATCTGDVTVSLLGSSYDTKLAVYRTSTCYPAAAALIECNDDFGSSYQSQITFAGTSGQQYLIEVGGYGSAKGQGKLTTSCTGTTPTQQKPDLGDAPDSTNNLGKVMHAYPSPVLVPGNFPTVYDDLSGMGPRGPAHVNTQVVAYLGKKITSETEADKGTDEDGVNNIRPLSDTANRDDGDDSVVFPLNLPNCGWANIDYTVTVVTPGTDLWVNVWLDFNRDGDWDDNVNCPTGVVPEWAVQNQYLFGLPAGVNQLTSRPFLSWHPKSGQENIWMRITLSERPWKGGTAAGQVGNGGSGPLTKYQVGETEDYYFVPQTTDTECQLCQDVNGDGNINMDDLAAFVSLWLANCQ